MPKQPYLPGGQGRSHFYAKQHQPRGTINYARGDEMAYSKYVRQEHRNKTDHNASEGLNQSAPKLVHVSGHVREAVKYPQNPKPRHHTTEAHKPDRTALSASMPDLGRIRPTVPLLDQNPERGIQREYDRRKHGWYHPRARSHNDMLALNQGSRSWAKDIKMSHNHIGYGDGIIGYGDVQETAISSDFPEWGSGPRTVPGPYGVAELSRDRVGRFPACFISNGQLRTLLPTFKRGPNLSIIETFHDPDALNFSDEHKGGGDRLDSTRSNYSWKKDVFDYKPFRAGITQKSQMHGGGCLIKRNYIPPSNSVEVDPVVHMHAGHA